MSSKKVLKDNNKPYMEELFQKIPVEICNQRTPKEKCKLLVNAIVSGWQGYKLGQKLTPQKKKKLVKIFQKEEGKIMRRITEENQEFCDWKVQIQWNKLQWVNPRIHDVFEKSFKR